MCINNAPAKQINFSTRVVPTSYLLASTCKMVLPLFIPVSAPTSGMSPASSCLRQTPFVGSNLPNCHSQPLYRTKNQFPIRRTQVTCSTSYKSVTDEKNKSTESPPEPAYKKTPTHWRIPWISFLIEHFITKVTHSDLARKYGPVYITDFMGKSHYIVAEMNAIKQIYKDAKTFTSGAAVPASFDILFGKKALFSMDGPSHLEKRNSVIPAFLPGLLEIYLEPIISASESLWSNAAKDLEKKKRIKLEPYIRNKTLSQIVLVTTGQESVTDLSFEEIRAHAYKIPYGLYFPEWKPMLDASVEARNALVDAYVKEMKNMLITSADKIEQLRSYGEDLGMEIRKMKGSRLNLLLVLVALSPLKTGPGQTHDYAILEELAELLMLLWLAGYSTQSMATLWSVMTMGFDKEIWRRLVAEQDALAEKHGSRNITVKQLMKEMPLLDSYVMEILRMYPGVPTLFRKVTTDAAILGHLIPKGATITLDFWGAQRDEKYYKNPDDCVIDRFIDKENPPPNIHSFGVVGGPHFCVGSVLAKISIKSILSTLLRHYEMTLDPKQNRNWVVFPEFMPQSGVMISSLKRRFVDEKAHVSK